MIPARGHPIRRMAACFDYTRATSWSSLLGLRVNWHRHTATSGSSAQPPSPPLHAGIAGGGCPRQERAFAPPHSPDGRLSDVYDTAAGGGSAAATIRRFRPRLLDTADNMNYTLGSTPPRPSSTRAIGDKLACLLAGLRRTGTKRTATNHAGPFWPHAPREAGALQQIRIRRAFSWRIVRRLEQTRVGADKRLDAAGD